jgi:hypothetical protein
MSKIDIRDLIIRELKQYSVDENSSSNNKIIDSVDFEFIAESIVKKIAEQQCDISVVGSSMVVLMDNTTKNDYGLFTDKIVAIKKQGQTIILEPQDLKQLEKTLGCKFKI